MFIWILIAYVIVRSGQDNCNVERQFKYLNKLEEKINVLLGEIFFSRECEYYLKYYSVVVDIILHMTNNH